MYGWIAPDAIRAKAEAAVDRAMAIDASLAEANFSKAFYTFYFGRKWRDARPHFSRAIELNPRASLHMLYFALFASMEYRVDEVEQLLARSVVLDPLSPFLHGLSSTAYYALGMHAPALAAAQKTIELQPDYLLGVWTHGLALCALGRYAEGIPQLERAVAMSRAPFFVCVLGLGLGLAGRADDARQLLAELDDRASRGEYVPPFTRLAIHVGLGDLVNIRRELAAALEVVTPPFSFRVTSGVFLDRYRSDPEVARLLDAWFAGEQVGPVT